jgi:hypothetical protein
MQMTSMLILPMAGVGHRSPWLLRGQIAFLQQLD